MGVEMNERHGSAAKVAVFSALMQWLMLAFTFIVWTVLQRLARAAGSPVEARATLALGLLTVAAYLAGTIVQRFRISRIIGFLIAGFVAGPAWLGLVRGDELAVLTAIATGALALIAFAVGGELTLDALRGARRTVILRLTAGAIAVPFIAVTLVALTVSAWFPLTAHQPFEDALTVALALGALATVASPVITWSVITETGASGPMSRTVRDVTIVQDVAAVAVFIVVLALARPLASHGAVTPGIALRALLVLGGSLIAGAALGYAAAHYLRAIQGHLEWVLLVFAFIVAQALRLAGLDPVLVALAAGFTLRNAPAGGMTGARVRAELARCAVPVYVVFFALAGSNLRLAALSEIWPWALLFVGLRAMGLWAGLRWAGRHGTIGSDLVNYGWLGLISQGGLAITLAAILRRAFPEWNVSLEALVVAMIGVHQLVGPICFHWALRRAGEITQVEETHVRESAGGGTGSIESVAPGAGGGGVVATGGSVY
jgi:Kef-type K+ transport system membrane component KefB